MGAAVLGGSGGGGSGHDVLPLHVVPILHSPAVLEVHFDYLPSSARIAHRCGCGEATTFGHHPAALDCSSDRQIGDSHVSTRPLHT